MDTRITDQDAAAMWAIAAAQLAHQEHTPDAWADALARALAIVIRTTNVLRDPVSVPLDGIRLQLGHDGTSLYKK